MNNTSASPVKVVVIGGGTGIYPVTTALKRLPVELSTVVAVTDSGGSSGRIRDEFGFQPVGDLRQSLAALADGEGQDWIRQLLLYRFSKGNGLKGHNLGNLILTALQDMTGTTSEALLRATQIFGLKGQIIPATSQVVDLLVSYQDGSTLVGEDYLNPESNIKKPVDHVSFTQTALITQEADVAIRSADIIIIGPGDYFGSLQAALLPEGMKVAFANSTATVIFVVNLMTRQFQTDHMTALDHVRGIEQTIGKQLNVILVNNQPIPPTALAHYHSHHEHPVRDDLEQDPRVVRSEILADESIQSQLSDQLSRSYLRHDSHKLEQVLARFIAKK